MVHYGTSTTPATIRKSWTPVTAHGDYSFVPLRSQPTSSAEAACRRMVAQGLCTTQRLLDVAAARQDTVPDDAWMADWLRNRRKEALRDQQPGAEMPRARGSVSNGEPSVCHFYRILPQSGCL